MSAVIDHHFSRPESPRILIVDDSPQQQRALAELLRRQRYRVSAVSDGHQGYQYALARPPDLILLDVCMPVMDGLAACRLLKADAATRHIPIIFLSAHDDPDERVAGLMAGAVDYVRKPYSAEEVALRVRIHLELARGRARPPRETMRHDPEQVLVDAVRQLLSTHLDALLTLADIADAVGTYEKRLSQVFRQRTGMTVFACLTQQRMERARELLAGTTLDIQDIALQVGYNSAANFATAFRAQMTLTPRAYRQSMRQQGTPP
ncbi:response regulator [Massilia sp. MB5]|uniref:response regulator transcription factor n=1 Tax=Massilia sp. MB5 TaxID=2919578 RepID=UPI001F0F38E9|nr:response regulator [Massilia sp. MB5]UMR31937.1 response regulator [Massilia sp. MB5]